MKKSSYEGLQSKIKKLKTPAIETWDNIYRQRDYVIDIDMPEFTCICPKTGLPDFARISIRYTPDKTCIELKSLKYYELFYRDIGIFHENVVNKIIDLETSAVLPFDGVAQGELCVRGPQVMKGYWNRPEETAVTLDAEGWLHTGDICRVDADGFFYIVDRKKDMIIASGFKVLPRDVEEVLFLHPKVMEAVVVGIPHPQRGDDTVKAYIVLKPGEPPTVEELKQFCALHLAQYKIPRAIEFRSELPKTMVGKVLRRVLVDEEKAKQG